MLRVSSTARTLFRKSFKSPVFITIRAASMTNSTHEKRDPNTLSNYDKFRTRHTTVNFNIDFEAKRLHGNVKLNLEAVGQDEEVVLDTSFLKIHDVQVNGATAKWEVADRVEHYGAPLKVQVGQVELGKNVEVSIDVETTKDCTALQWLTKEQTSNKRHPYMFSQCQAIHARSCFPCQDTPDVKSPFTFNLRSPLPVLASGLPTGSKDYEPSKDGKSGTLLYTFQQDVPIPSYLFAVASGDIAIASVGPRSVVATGPDELKAVKWELDDMENFMEAAEKILQKVPYAWTTYNVLVLPPSFPYGGMENPVFTFATPTIISGDRENIDVIAHELSHSWSGNLVSNASWESFWLNEGWTTYLERRIQRELHGEPHRHFSAIIGRKALIDSIEHFGADHPFTKLHIDLKGKDPDDAFSSIPYEKGFTFLFYLEHLLGFEKFDSFIPHYFSTWARRSLTSFDFKDTLLSFFTNDAESSRALQSIDWDTWLYGTGMPPWEPKFDTSLADACYALADKWKARAADEAGFEPAKADIHGWSSSQIVVFLEKIELLDKPLRAEDAELMAKTYGFVETNNVEVSSRFLTVALKAGDKGATKPTAELLGKVGRMKFVRKLYRALKDVDRPLAEETFKKNEDFYHPICRQMVNQDLFGEK